MKKTQEKTVLDVTTRTALGKKVKQLRKKNIIPANIYGSDFKSISISIPLKEFASVHRQAGETGIVYLQLEGKSIPTLIKEIAIHSVNENFLHIDFRQINLNEKIETDVPVETEGESIAVTQLGGVLLTQVSELLIEALPANIPPHITIDLTTILEIGQEIRVKDLPTSTEYIIKEDPEKVIISVVEHKEESLEAETDRAETEITTEKADEEGAEGTDGKEPAAPADEKKEE